MHVGRYFFECGRGGEGGEVYLKKEGLIKLHIASASRARPLPWPGAGHLRAFGCLSRQTLRYTECNCEVGDACEHTRVPFPKARHPHSLGRHRWLGRPGISSGSRSRLQAANQRRTPPYGSDPTHTLPIYIYTYIKPGISLYHPAGLSGKTCWAFISPFHYRHCVALIQEMVVAWLTVSCWDHGSPPVSWKTGVLGKDHQQATRVQEVLSTQIV